MQLVFKFFLQIELHRRSLHRDKRLESTISRILCMKRTQIAVLLRKQLGIYKKTRDQYPKSKLCKAKWLPAHIDRQKGNANLSRLHCKALEANLQNKFALRTH